MGDHDGGFAEFFLELEDEVGHVGGHDGIDHGGGLVVEDGVGIFGEGAGNGDGALGAGG